MKLAADILRDMASEPFEYQYDGFAQPTVGAHLEWLFFQSESHFEQTVVTKFPYEVRFPTINLDNMDVELAQLDIRFARVNAFLGRFAPHMYKAFPSSAIGRYKDCACNSVFLKDPNHAIQLKLAFLV